MMVLFNTLYSQKICILIGTDFIISVITPKQSLAPDYSVVVI